MAFRHFTSLTALTGAAAAALIGTSRASDMGVIEPDARLALISEQRDLERQCAGLAIAEAKRVGIPTEEQALSLAEAVASRLGSDLGSPAVGFIHATSGALHWLDPTIPQDALERERKEALTACKAILRAAGKHDQEKVLSPPSSRPLLLPDVETCLAYASVGRQMPGKVSVLAKDFEHVRARWFAGLGSAELHRREQSLNQKIISLKPQPDGEKVVVYLTLACQPAVRALMRGR